jgi:hypothetical protein
MILIGRNKTPCYQRDFGDLINFLKFFGKIGLTKTSPTFAYKCIYKHIIVDKNMFYDIELIIDIDGKGATGK